MQTGQWVTVRWASEEQVELAAKIQILSQKSNRKVRKLINGQFPTAVEQKRGCAFGSEHQVRLVQDSGVEVSGASRSSFHWSGGAFEARRAQ